MLVPLTVSCPVIAHPLPITQEPVLCAVPIQEGTIFSEAQQLNLRWGDPSHRHAGMAPLTSSVCAIFVRAAVSVLRTARHV